MRKIILPVVTVLVITGLYACTWDKGLPDSNLTDAALFGITTDTTGKVYYQNSAILPPAGGSPHGNFRLRFNSKAASVLDGSLELPVGQTFPDSSLIVKEALDGSNTLSIYAVMYKYKGSWLWAEYYAGGSVIYSNTLNGPVCISCHSAGANRDLVRTFDEH